MLIFHIKKKLVLMRNIFKKIITSKIYRGSYTKTKLFLYMVFYNLVQLPNTKSITNNWKIFSWIPLKLLPSKSCMRTTIKLFFATQFKLLKLSYKKRKINFETYSAPFKHQCARMELYNNNWITAQQSSLKKQNKIKICVIQKESTLLYY